MPDIDGPRLLRVAGVFLAVGSLAWFVVGLVLAITFDPPDQPHWLALLGVSLGLVVAIFGGVVVAIGEHLTVERRWREDVRRGMATLSDLRPGDANEAAQVLTCRLEIEVDGQDSRHGEHRTSVGPLDAARMVEGATFPCQTSPSVPKRIRVWLYADPEATELTGRYLDFRPL
ncbi:hypothetical protein GCM10022251_59120 [Phytohabitans flavus]|uniref:Uncharacterized protein n=1 Tax=Phytohabitans flavus TaxID=1076124 RepID=A0A6F8XXN4_9ACTN|nr:hypothetical protein [Phytohabitans flavus]BCB78573.1 hypothetical protein Pflav_049830 [Phytohabitans flavus]